METNYKAEVIADSISPAGNRITTMVITYPRIILAEFNTHRMFSRNSASSRAIPTEKILEQVAVYPFEPAYLGKNKKGMQASEEVSDEDKNIILGEWLLASDRARASARAILEKGSHKQIVNRLLEPWMWMTTIVTATEWDNFFALRCHKDAQPEFQILAWKMLEAYLGSTPFKLNYGDWHAPFQETVFEEERVSVADILKISIGRCARVSYLTHDGKRDIHEDISLHNRLAKNGHMSPFEHVAQCMDKESDDALSSSEWYGNFRGWKQYRKMIANENRKLSEYDLKCLLESKPEWII